MAGGKPRRAPHSGGPAPHGGGQASSSPPMAGGKPPRAPHGGGQASSSATSSPRCQECSPRIGPLPPYSAPKPSDRSAAGPLVGATSRCTSASSATPSESSLPLRSCQTPYRLFPIPADAEPADAALGGPPILAVAALGAPPRVAPPRPPGAATYPTPPPPLCGRWPPGLNTTSIRLRLRRMRWLGFSGPGCARPHLSASPPPTSPRDVGDSDESRTRRTGPRPSVTVVTPPMHRPGARHLGLHVPYRDPLGSRFYPTGAVTSARGS